MPKLTGKPKKSKIETFLSSIRNRNEVNKNNLKTGFTLAEVLITLVIIGIIASLVIPAIINDTQEAEQKTAWKKTYSELEQATRRIMMDNGGTMKGYLKTTRSALIPQYNQFLSCTKQHLTDGLFNTASNNYKYLNGAGANTSLFDDGQFILSNGVFIALEDPAGNTIYTAYDVIWVDVNGFKKGPNIIGKDTFGVQVMDTGIKPLGSQGDGYEDTCSTSSTGWGCSAKYLYQ